MNNVEKENQNVTQTPVGQQPQATPAQQPQVKPTLAQASNIAVDGEGFNLIPAMSEEEKVKIKTKNTLNIGSILSIIALASVAIGIVGFNILSKAQLNVKKSSLFKIEKTVNAKMDTIIANNAIVDRAVLYTNVKKDSFSHKKIIEFFNETAEKIGGVEFTSINISEKLNFEISGQGTSLEQLSKLWYLFGVHENVKVINLESVGKTEEGIRFSFQGDLDITNFKND